MKKVVVITLALLALISMTACDVQNETADNDTTNNPTTSEETINNINDADQLTENPTDSELINVAICTTEDYDKAVETITETTGGSLPSYREVVELFGGVEGTVSTDMEYEEYRYYTWTDGTRTVLITFEVDGDVETYFAISGDIQ